VGGDSPFEPLPEAPSQPPLGPTGRPATLFEEEMRPGAQPQPAPIATGAPVLIADEARPFREQLVQALQTLGVRCAVVEDGESALRYVQENHPQLMLVNVYLRRLLGIIVCERVKADPLLRSTRVVLIGALFRKDRFVREPGRLYGADDYIEEAVSPQELQERLAALLGGAGAGAAAARSGGGAAEISEDLQRLIRIILSDIALYYPERCEAAVREGRFQDEFRVELEEGRRLIADRFPDSRRAAEIYIRAVSEWVEERQRALVP
jgi:DNA-binding response OmpR family regulator